MTPRPISEYAPVVVSASALKRARILRSISEQLEADFAELFADVPRKALVCGDSVHDLCPCDVEPAA